MKQALQQAIAKFSRGRVLVIGDVAIDEMVYGATARLSREAPVLILNHQRTDIILGAAGNAVHNVAKLQASRAAVIGGRSTPAGGSPAAATPTGATPGCASTSHGDAGSSVITAVR